MAAGDENLFPVVNAPDQDQMFPGGNPPGGNPPRNVPNDQLFADPTAPVRQGPIGNTTGKPMSTEEFIKANNIPMETPEDVAKREALQKQFAGRGSTDTSGPLATFAGSMANAGLYGFTPYLAAAMPGGPVAGLPYNRQLEYYKDLQDRNEAANPRSDWAGTGTGIVVGAPLAASRALGVGLQGMLYGLTQGGTGLEDWVSGKSDITAPLSQAALGTAEALGAQRIFSKINPQKIQDAASYAYNLGAPLAAGMMDATKKGFEYLAPKAQQTVNSITNGFTRLTEGMGAQEAGQALLNAFGSGRSIASNIENAIYEPVRRMGLLNNTTEFAPTNMMTRLTEFMNEYAPTLPQESREYIERQLQPALSTIQNQTGLTLNQMRNLGGVIWDAAENLPRDVREQASQGLKYIWGGLRDDMRETADMVGQQVAVAQNMPMQAAQEFGQKAAEAFDRSTAMYGKAQSYLRNLKNDLTENDPTKVFEGLRNMAYHPEGSQYLTFLKDALGSASQEWRAFQNGMLRHLGGDESFRFGNFLNRYGRMMPDVRAAIMEGRPDAARYVKNLRGLARNTMDEGENILDRALQNAANAKPERLGEQAFKFVKRAATNPATLAGGAANLFGGLSYLPALGVAGLAYGAKKGLDATGRAALRRNAAQSPGVRQVLTNAANAATRGATSGLTNLTSGVTEGISSGLNRFQKNILSPEASKWYSKNAPWILGGGRAAGGRAAYKSGGAVTDIEPLVRNLMNRAAQAKKMTNKDTEVLLNSHDDAIASALEVAQKSI